MPDPARNLAKSNSPKSSRSQPPAQKSTQREYAEAIGIAFVLALILRTFVVQAYKIPSGSMEPTLLIGDHILVNKMDYGLRMPDSLFGFHIPGLPYGHYLFRFQPVHRGDVVVFVFPLDPTKDFIKRVIGVAGDTVAVKDGVVYLNGTRMKDPHGHYSIPDEDRSASSPRDYFGPVKVPPHDLFVMGDNRDHSYDSRFWGFVNRRAVEGRAIIIYWSWNSKSSSWLDLIRWNRFGKLIH